MWFDLVGVDCFRLNCAIFIYHYIWLDLVGFNYFGLNSGIWLDLIVQLDLVDSIISNLISFELASLYDLDTAIDEGDRRALVIEMVNWLY